MKLFCFRKSELNCPCGYEYETIFAENKREARKYAKDHFLAWRGYIYKIVSINEIF